MIRVLIAAVCYLTLFVGIEVITIRARLDKELSRKAAHILAGTSAAFLPLVMSFKEIMVLSLLFLPVMLLSKRKNLFSSIHQVSRTTYGEVYFPISIFLTALLFPEAKIYMYGILIMSLSDGLASVIGQKFGAKKYRLWQGEKSYAGSATFLLSAFLLGLILLPAVNPAGIASVLLLAAILTVVEASLSYGFDNLFLPPIAGGLFLLITR